MVDLTSCESPDQASGSEISVGGRHRRELPANGRRRVDEWLCVVARLAVIMEPNPNLKSEKRRGSAVGEGRGKGKASPAKCNTD